MDHQHPSAPERALITAAEPSALTTAICVGQEMLAAYGTTDYADPAAVAQALGAIRESLRILLRALGAEPDGRSEGWTSVTEVQVPGAEMVTGSRNHAGQGQVAGLRGMVAKGTRIGRTPGAESESANAGKISTPVGTAGHRDQRCPAAHPEDPDPCDGPPVVTVLDRENAGADGCEHHAARLLASLDGGRVYPLPHAPDGAPIKVFRAADGIRPFPWIDAPRTQPSQLSRAEQRERGEDQ